MNYLYGDDPESRSRVQNDLLDVIISHWELNAVYPSTVPW